MLASQQNSGGLHAQTNPAPLQSCSDSKQITWVHAANQQGRKRLAKAMLEQTGTYPHLHFIVNLPSARQTGHYENQNCYLETLCYFIPVYPTKRQLLFVSNEYPPPHTPPREGQTEVALPDRSHEMGCLASQFSGLRCQDKR